MRQPTAFRFWVTLQFQVWFLALLAITAQAQTKTVDDEGHPWWQHAVFS